MRIRFEDGIEKEELRYSALREGGRLAIVELHESSDRFFFHQVSIAGTSYSESFYKKGESIRVEHERIGDFMVHPIER